MEYDELMYYQAPNEPISKMKVLNTLIHEELGKVDVIFTDKTGTLTSNTMVFRHANIAGEDFSENELNEILCKQKYSTLA